MGLDILAGLVLGGIVFITWMVHITGSWKPKDEPDTGTALVEFGMSYPGEAIRAVISTADDKTHFFRLASANTGYLHQMGNHCVARLIGPGAVLVDLVDDSPTLKVDFREVGLPAGTYSFASEEDAAEVSLWLMGTLAMVQNSPGMSGNAPLPDAENEASIEDVPADNDQSEADEEVKKDEL